MLDAKADLEDVEISLDRVKELIREGLTPKQSVDDARAPTAVHRNQLAATNVRAGELGPRHEQIDSLRGQVEQAKGALDYAETNRPNTIIRAPVTGTILERAVEKGEFVTTSFVGDRGAKGYVVSIADLNDLEVELDISQNDFAKLRAGATWRGEHGRFPGPQIRRLHQGDFTGSEPAKGHGADQGEGDQAR